MKKSLKPFVIYTFVKGRVLYGVARFKNDVIDINYGYGFRLNRDKKLRNKDNTPERIKMRARRSVVSAISNTLNAILLYGDECMENDEINWEMFKQKELQWANEVIKNGDEFEEIEGEKSKEREDRLLKTFENDRRKFEEGHEIKSFEVIEIPITVAKENRLI